RSPGKGRRRPTLVAVPPTETEGHSAQDAGDDPAGAGRARPGGDEAGTGEAGEAALPGGAGRLGDAERLSDVDEWGRSQHLRDILATLYDPIYDSWFRVEWEGFEKIPREGGALMVANLAGAIPT